MRHGSFCQHLKPRKSYIQIIYLCAMALQCEYKLIKDFPIRQALRLCEDGFYNFGKAIADRGFYRLGKHYLSQQGSLLLGLLNIAMSQQIHLLHDPAHSYRLTALSRCSTFLGRLGAKAA